MFNYKEYFLDRTRKSSFIMSKNSRFVYRWRGLNSHFQIHYDYLFRKQTRLHRYKMVSAARVELAFAAPFTIACLEDKLGYTDINIGRSDGTRTRI
jgi:hypothetical protein